MEYIKWFIDLILHLDKHLADVVSAYGTLTYAILLGVVFCETGLVVTPVLPGDSLLFAAGAIAALGQLNVHLLFLLLAIAAVLGDGVNYAVGHFLGPKVLERENSRIFKREYLDKTRSYFAKYGGKTIIIARFVPIVRTFAPFLAGVGEMTYPQFALYNVTGGIAWVAAFIYGGYFFGAIPVVQRNFTFVIFAIIFVSILPGLIEFVRVRRQRTALAG